MPDDEDDYVDRHLDEEFPIPEEGEISALALASLRTRTRRHQWLYNLGRAARTPRGAFGLIVVTFVVLVAVIGPFVTPYSPTNFVTLPFAQPSKANLLGGDTLGRDVLSRVLDGGWELLLMALAATVIGVTAGAVAGISAAYLRGRWDGIIMRSVDVILAFPQLVFALLLVSIIGPKVWIIVIAVGVSHAPQVALVPVPPPLTSRNEISSRPSSSKASRQRGSWRARSFRTSLPRSWWRPASGSRTRS